jgi:hypothetical protein
MNMIVDLRNDSNRVYFNGILPSYPVYLMRLVAIYSNKEILNNTFGSIELTNLYEAEDWFSFNYLTNISSLQRVELNEYYTCQLIGLDKGIETIIQENLCKVLNNFSIDDSNTNYISDNEDNEQYIYFIND